MLDKHFKVHTDAKTKIENIIFYENYRISLLKERLIRIEKSENKKFLDYPTKAIWFRNFDILDKKVTEYENGIEIVVNHTTYFIGKNFEDSYVIINNKRIKMDNEGNLLSTYEGLDGADGDVDDHYSKPAKPLVLEKGVCSKSGVAIIDDSKTCYLNEEGFFIPIEEEHFDVYVFAFGHEYQEAVKAFYDISGKVPLVPRYVLGNWWSRYHEYKDQEYLDLMDKFIEKNIPICVATIDTDWHPSGNILQYYKIKELDRMKIEYGFEKDLPEWRWGWTGYSFDLTCFKNPKKFLKQLHKRGLKVTLNLHPYTICWYEKEYDKIATDMGMNPKELKPIYLDFANDKFINSYFNDLHKNLEHDGVDFWWIDDNTKLLFNLAHFYFLDSGKEHQPIILNRYAGVGSHRYPIGFSGDSVISWKSLKYLPYFTATSSNIGYTWWSHDIGAFMAGIKDDELYLRYVQLGVFLPILRLHSQNNAALTKEPWAYKNGIGEIAINHLRLRHQMIPYLYSAAYRNSVDGLPLIEPVYYYYPEDERAYTFKTQYFFNGHLLVAPITKHSEKSRLCATKVFLPEGKWTDIFTNDVYEGGKVINMVRGLDSIPVLAKEGTIFVLSNDPLTNSIANPKSLLIDVYNGNSTFTFYEDNELKDGSFIYFETHNDGHKQYLSIMFENHGALVLNRTFKIRFKNIRQGNVYSNQHVNVQNKEFLEVIIKHVDVNSIYELEVEYKEDSKLDILKRQGLESITTFEGVNDERVEIYNQIAQVKTVSEYIKVVNNSKLSKIYKQRLKECK